MHLRNLGQPLDVDPEPRFAGAVCANDYDRSPRFHFDVKLIATRARDRAWVLDTRHINLLPQFHERQRISAHNESCRRPCAAPTDEVALLVARRRGPNRTKELWP